MHLPPQTSGPITGPVGWGSLGLGLTASCPDSSGHALPSGFVVCLGIRDAGHGKCQGMTPAVCCTSACTVFTGKSVTAWFRDSTCCFLLLCDPDLAAAYRPPVPYQSCENCRHSVLSVAGARNLSPGGPDPPARRS